MNKKYDIKMHKPRSCARCRVYTRSIQRYKMGSLREWCSLGFETIKLEKPVLWKEYIANEDIEVFIKPKGRCPKPRTIDEHIKAYKLWEQGLIGKKFNHELFN